MGKKITELYAWITTDPADGNEGVPATSMEIGGVNYFVPLLGADLQRMSSLHPKVLLVKARVPGTAFKLRRFIVTDEVLEEL